jgi:coenzyme F420-reducing hydrogenase delta subunit
MKEAEAAGEEVRVAFTCAESAGGSLTIDEASGRCDELPGYRVMPVPCAGWVHPLMIERALRHGARGVLIAACGPGQCLYREGASWEQLRLEGKREPVLRTDKVEPDEVRLVSLDRTRKRELIREALDFNDAQLGSGQDGARRAPVVSAVASAFLALVAAVVVGVISDAGFAAPAVTGSELLVSFKHPGQVGENCRVLSEEELAARPVHMRKAKECERMRASVRLAVEIDGKEVVRTSAEPSGIWKDGNSVTIQTIPVDPGEHRVSIAIGETLDPDEWTFRDEKTLGFDTDTRRVIVFDRVAGFSWH